MHDVLSTESFTSIWFWIFMALAWNSLSHWTMGVPFDAVVRADRRGGVFEDHVDDIAHAMAARMVHVTDLAGPWLVGVGTFLLTGLGIAAILLWMEFAQACFVFLLPLTAVTVKEMLFARAVIANDLRGAKLRKALFWQRFMTQIAGVVSLVAAAAFLMNKLLMTKPYLFLSV